MWINRSEQTIICIIILIWIVILLISSSCCCCCCSCRSIFSTFLRRSTIETTCSISTSSTSITWTSITTISFERLAPFWALGLVVVVVSPSPFSCWSNGNGTHFCLPFFFRVRGVFDWDVPASLSFDTVCSLVVTDDSTVASARLGQSFGYKKKREHDERTNISYLLVKEQYQVVYQLKY